MLHNTLCDETGMTKIKKGKVADGLYNKDEQEQMLWFFVLFCFPLVEIAVIF